MVHIGKNPDITKEKVWKRITTAPEPLPKLVKGMFEFYRIGFKEAYAYNVGSTRFADQSWKESALTETEFNARSESLQKESDMSQDVLKNQCSMMIEDLQKLGVNADIFIRNYAMDKQPGWLRAIGTDFLVRVEDKSNFDTSVMLLAYLLYKGLVDEKDIPAGDTVYPIQEVTAPFGRSMFKFANSIEYQKKVRKKLGEPLLKVSAEECAATPKHGILHTDKVTSGRAGRNSDEEYWGIT